MGRFISFVCCLVVAGCSSPEGSLEDGGPTDAAALPSDAAPDALRDAAATLDGAAPADAPPEPMLDAGSALDADLDAGDLVDAALGIDASTPFDAGVDASTPFDAGVDASTPFDAGVDASTPFDAGIDAPVSDAGPAFTPAPHSLAPPLTSLGGPILDDPAIVTITYMNDARRDEIEAFGATMVAETAWWSASTAEYGIGPVSLLANVRLTTAAPAAITQAQIETFLRQQAMMGLLPRRGGSYDGIVYMLYFPVTSRVTLSSGSVSCSGWHGVHGEVSSGSIHFAYAIDVMCGPGRGFDDLGYLEAAASHELVEAVTDPFPRTMPAYAMSGAVVPWAVYGELTDRCVGQYVSGAGFVLARNWSNAAAAADLDPCVPAPSGAYYNVTTPMTTVRGAAGTNVAVPITGYSTAPVPDFRVSVFRAAGFNSAPTLDATLLNNGVSTMLNLTIPAGTAAGTPSWVVVTSGPSSGDLRNFPILVIAE